MHNHDQERPSDARSGVGDVLDLLGLVAKAFLLALVIRLFVLEIFIVPSGSMLDTIQIDDRIIVEKVSIHFTSPKQGSIVIFDSPVDPSVTLVKRVIAIGGQTVDLQDGAVLVDGERLDEPYVEGKETYPLTSTFEGVGAITYPYTVPEGSIWVMGDNRTNSRDSRYYGAVPLDSVTGHALLTYWPLSDMRLL